MGNYRGSILKGETSIIGAVRELKEETGISVETGDLKPTIKLQDGETVDYQFLLYDRFKEFIKTRQFVYLIRRRFFKHEKAFDQIIDAIYDVKY